MNRKKKVSCPFCGHQVNTVQGISSHIQQTRCNIQSGLVPLSSFVSVSSGVSEDPTPQNNPFPFSELPDYSEDSTSDIQDHLEPHSSNSNLSEAAGEGPYTIEYPHAAQVLGHGKTALDLFDEDQFVDERILNFYYPWASKGEWEVTQYLLKSALSLENINESLKLQLVCFLYYPVFQNTSILFIRSRRWTYRSQQQKNFVLMQTFFLPYYNGNTKLSQLNQGFHQKTLSSSTTATLLNAFRMFLEAPWFRTPWDLHLCRYLTWLLKPWECMNRGFLEIGHGPCR